MRNLAALDVPVLRLLDEEREGAFGGDVEARHELPDSVFGFFVVSPRSRDARRLPAPSAVGSSGERVEEVPAHDVPAEPARDGFEGLVHGDDHEVRREH